MQLHSALTKLRTTPVPRIWKTFRRRRRTTYPRSKKPLFCVCACSMHACMREARGPRINFVQKSLCHTGCMICVRSWSFFLTNKSEVFRSSNRHSVLVMTPNQLKLCRRNENAMLNRAWRIMPAEKLAELSTFSGNFMHVWYVDKEMEQNSRNCPP